MLAAADHGPLLGVGVDVACGDGASVGLAVADGIALGGTELTDVPGAAHPVRSITVKRTEARRM